MPIYTVDISCRSSDHDYTPLFERLRSANAVSYMDARWLLDVREDINDVVRSLLQHCAPGDRLFITELAPETRWSGTGLREEVKAWLLARMKDVTPHDPPAKQ